MQRVIVHDGHKFSIQSSGKYYQSYSKVLPERLLHRYVWHTQRGPIPPKHHVHHLNDNWSDNRIENLELLPGRVHCQQHMRKRLSTPEGKAAFAASLDLARKAAPEWHRSPEGLAWHSENGKRTWEGRETADAVCQECGTGFQTYFTERAKFCSKACTMRDSYKRMRAVGNCERCKVEFTFNKYRAQRFCSRVCGIWARCGK